MKRVAILVGILAITFTACSEDGTNNPLFNPNFTALKQDIKVGLYPNRILSDGQYVYVVNSGDNTVGKLSLSTYEYDNNFIKLDQGTNPYSISLKSNHLYISSSGKMDDSYNADDIIVDVDLSTGSKTEVLKSLFMVSDIITSTCIEFVESEYDYANSTAKGKVTQYCPDQTLSVPTSCKNPTRIMENEDGYIVTCSGVYSYDADYNITGTVGSGVCFYNSHLEETSCKMEDKDSGSPSVGEKTILIGSTYSGNLTIIKNNTLDTISLVKNSMLVPVHLYNDIYAIAGFNNSTLYLYDAETKAVITEYSMSKTDLDKKGPLDMVYLPDTSQLIVLNSLSATIDVFTIN